MTRMEAARRRLRLARYAIAVSAVALLAALGAAARASHPATRTSPSPSVETSDDSASTAFFSDDDDGYSVGPAGSAQPLLQSGGS